MKVEFSRARRLPFPAVAIMFNSAKRLLLVALAVVVFDQATKRAVLRLLDQGQERVVVDGFFKFVHWHNTGAAWSLFRGNNDALAVISVIALIVLFFARRHFDNDMTSLRQGEVEKWHLFFHIASLGSKMMAMQP